MIFHTYECIFFHTPKTAGSAIENMFMPNHELDPYQSNNEQLFGLDHEIGIFLQHATCKTTRALIDRNVYDAYFKFCVVRNPFARVLSVYSYQVEHHKREFGNFKGFVRALPALATNQLYLRGSHYIPQIHYAYIDGVREVDAVGKFEELDRFVQELRERFGDHLTLPQINFRHKPERKERVQDHYDEETSSIIREVYKDDFEFFGY